METIYWSVNGEVRVEKQEKLEEYDKLREEGEVEPLVVHEEGDEYGHFRDSILAFPHPRRKHGLLVYVVREWIPEFGYSWSEVQIKRIEI
jgi:hypothetical protein